MAIPVIYPYPIKRPGFIEQAVWIGPDDDLSLEVRYRDTSDNLQTVPLPCSSGGQLGKICLPSSATINDISRDTLIAHLRMSTLISGSIPGSAEWTDAFVNQADTNNLQTAIGNVKVTAIDVVDQQLLDVTLQKTSGGPTVVVRTDYNELGTYAFAPSTQLYCVAGAIEKQFPTYVHDYPDATLSQAQKDAIADYVVALEQWI